MTRPLDRDFASEILNALEDRELPLLSWGITSGALARDEVVEIIDDLLMADHSGHGHLSADDVVDSLVREALLFEMPLSVPVRYRTRMAETVRLTTQLRQLFGPKDLERPAARWWEQGRPLVADYRIQTSPRRYPVRDITTTTAMADLARLAGWTDLHSEIAEGQIGGRSLARFQMEATRSIFSSINHGQGRGVIVGAGTGSGKTLAFYLPAFAAMAERTTAAGTGVQALALYPRTELLRDQMRDAVETAQTVSAALRKRGRRPIRIGALYANTPWTSTSRVLYKDWRSRGRDLVSPYFPCPTCGDDMVWPEAERKAGTETLRCVNGDLVLGPEDIALTRESLKANPPDLLFTTTEMLNKFSTDRGLGRLLGWRGGNPPRLVLLDEVHTYSGVHGAQVALLLRRWRHAVKLPVTFVGLSATLRDAGRFFSQLVGLDETAVDYIEPAAADLEPTGREYAIALRGDPVSGASLLSTSIQTAMLYGRVLDRRDAEYLYGSTGFIFTDDLDVTNRFYNDLRDAEGGQSRYGNRRRTGRVLAALRSPDAQYSTERFRDGQSWDLVQRIGRPLPVRADAGELRIGRTSSQDPGVNSDDDLIVATASLEVGYNDPHVGLVIQHKAPHDPAAFIQRRGRAGRQRHTRPWTVVTLSDYGRDRLAYQAYDTLLNPQVPARSLPIGNRFVLKIQGAQALLDWLGSRLRQGGDPRVLLASPKGAGKPPPPHQAEELRELLNALLRETSLQDDLTHHLRRALGISPDEAQALLWEQPRALLLGVAPTALRRLSSKWRPVERDGGANPGELLPEYLTRTLFSGLNVPEVWLDLPFGDDDEEVLGIEKALREAVPGRVSKRYGHRSDEHRTWLPLPDTGSDLDLADIVPAGSGIREGTWQPLGGQPLEVIRPQELLLAAPPKEVTDRSQGSPLWGSQIVEPAAGVNEADVPDPSPWRRRIISVGFATHAGGNPAEVRRMTMGAQCETSYQDGSSHSSAVRYVVDGATPAALGFGLTVDAIRFTIAPLNPGDPAVIRHLASPAWRTVAFSTAVAEDAALDGIANTFQRGWLTLVYLTAFALAGLGGTPSAQAIHTRLAGGTWRDELPRILQVLYRDADSGRSAAPERLITALTELSRTPQVTACLDRHGALLWGPDPASATMDLAQRAYRDTLAAAILAAAQRACPDAQDRDLIIDVIGGPTPADPGTVWLSETAIGGLGVVEQLGRIYARSPRQFWELVEATLKPSSHEYVDATLTRLLEHVVTAPADAAARAMAGLRTAPSAHHADTALGELLAAWAELDGHPQHAAVAALSTRLLRPGTNSQTDLVALGVIQAWQQVQDRLGFEVDARVIAYAVGSGQLPIPGMSKPLTADQVFSMLWPRGHQPRVQHLRHYQPYAGPAILDRLLAAAAHDERLPVIDVTAPDWAQHYAPALARHGAIELAVPAANGRQLSDAVRAVPVLAVDQDVMRLFGEVRGFSRICGELRVRVEIKEAVQ